MKIALIGHGAMGKLIGRLAEEKGDEIVVFIDDVDAGLGAGELAEKLKRADVAIDFTTASGSSAERGSVRDRRRSFG
jgi:prephenate dehydrogenase